MNKKTYIKPTCSSYEMNLENSILSGSGVQTHNFENGNEDWFSPRSAGPFDKRSDDAPQWPYK